MSVREIVCELGRHSVNLGGILWARGQSANLEDSLSVKETHYESGR